MDELLSSSLLPLLRKHWLLALLLSFGLFFSVAGLFEYLGQSKQTVTIQHAAAVPNEADPSAKKITVDIEGAVVNPGVYGIPSDARVQDGLIAAGGLSEKADRLTIARQFNLAAKLTDGAKLYFPFSGESIQTTTSGTAGQVAGAATSLVNLNTASAAELDGLPGIGQVTAQKIITNRPYQTVSDLTSKKVVSASVFGKIKDLVSVN